MPRQNHLHNADSIRRLVAEIRNRANQLNEAADALASSGQGRSVSVAFQMSVDDGLAAIESLRYDVLRKIAASKFIETADAPAKKKKTK